MKIDCWPQDEEGNYKCCMCDKSMPEDYKPEQACCSGYMCGCRGLPDWPAVCSQECNDKFMNK